MVPKEVALKVKSLYLVLDGAEGHLELSGPGKHGLGQVHLDHGLHGIPNVLFRPGFSSQVTCHPKLCLSSCRQGHQTN